MSIFIQAVGMSYDTSITSMSAQASKYDISPTQLRCHLRATSFVQARAMYGMFASLVMMSECIKLGCLTDIASFDDTKQRLLMSLGSGLLKTQLVQAPKVMVIIRELFFSTADDQMRGCLPWVAPPTGAITDTAGSIWAIFNKLPGMCAGKHYNKYVHSLLRNAEDLLRVKCQDGAKQNPKA